MESSRLRRLMRVHGIVRDAKRSDLQSAEMEVQHALHRLADAQVRTQEASRAFGEATTASVYEFEDRARAIVEAQKEQATRQGQLRQLEVARTSRQRELNNAEREIRSIGVVESKLARLEQRLAARREQMELDERARNVRRER